MKGCIKILLFACAMLLSGQVCAEIYTWTDAQGRVHFGDKPADNDRAQAVNVRINTFESVTYDSLGKGVPEPAARGGNVIMYATQWCGVCRKPAVTSMTIIFPLPNTILIKTRKPRHALTHWKARGCPSFWWASGV